MVGPVVMPAGRLCLALSVFVTMNQARLVLAQGTPAVPSGAAPAVAATVKPPPTSSAPVVSGYLQGLFTQSFEGNDDATTANGTFSTKRARLRVKGEVLSRVDYVVMVDASTPSNLLRDAFISLRLVPRHEIRLGQQKTLFGWENPESSTRLFTVNRGFASDALARGADLRDVGLGLLGDWPLPRGLGLDYQATLVNGAGPNTVQDDTPRKNLWARVGGSLRLQGPASVRLGTSYATGDQLRRPMPNATGTTVAFNRSGVDLAIDLPWLFVAAEVVWGTNNVQGEASKARGGHALAVGKLPWNSGPLFRFDELDPDRNVGGNRLRRLTFGAYADLRPTAVRLLVNFEHDLSSTPVARDDALFVMTQLAF